MRHANQTAPFRAASGHIIPGSIAEASYLRLGGLDQWVMIRGESTTNPVLIVLHGGPGFSDTAFLRFYTPELERSFTVVYWDQRGAGRSYRPTIPRPSMTVAQLLADLDELVEVVRRRLGKKTVALLGHSWGTALGVLYAARFPEKVTAYVGVAQIGDWAAGEALSYANAVAEAERQGNRAVLKKLRAIGPPPHTADRVFVERTCVQRLRGALKLKAMWKVTRMILGAPESSLFELRRTVRAFRFSMETLWPEVSRLNLLEAAPALAVPVVLMLGRRDPWVPPEASLAWYRALRAPSRELVWFEESGHEPFVDEPDRFVAAMLEVARPRCGPSSAVQAETPGAPHARQLTPRLS